MLWVVGLLKLVAIFRALKLPIASPVFAVAGGVLAVLLGHAAVFKLIGDHHQGRLPDGVMYAAWWGLGAIVVGYALMARQVTPVLFRGTRAGSRQGAVGHVILTLMLASLAAHLGTSHWIYSCPFHAPDVSPVLLALAVILAGVRGNGFVRRSDATLLCVMLPIAAVFTAWHPSRPLEAALEPLRITTLMLTGTLAYVTMIGIFAPRQFVRYAAAGVAAAAVYCLGPTWGTVQSSIERAYHWTADALDRFTPRSQGAWGTLALVGAFLLLAVGAAFSLVRPKKDEPMAGPATTVPGAARS